VLGLLAIAWTSKLIPLLGASLGPGGRSTALSRNLRAGFPKVCTETFPGMGDLFRKGLHSQIAFTPGAEDQIDATLAPKLPSSPPPDSVNLLTFLPRVRSGKLGKSMPHAASWPAALTALPLDGAERLLTEPAVAANRSLPDGAFPTLGAEGHDVVVRGPAIVHFRADWGRAPSFLSGGRASEANFLPPVRSRVPAAPVLCVLAVLTA
jgi:hypothetical protein